MPSTSSLAISNAAPTAARWHAVEHQVFFVDPRVSDEAVLSVAIEAAGLANNVNDSEAAIMASLGEVGSLIPMPALTGHLHAPRRS